MWSGPKPRGHSGNDPLPGNLPEASGRSRPARNERGERWREGLSKLCLLSPSLSSTSWKRGSRKQPPELSNSRSPPAEPGDFQRIENRPGVLLWLDCNIKRRMPGQRERSPGQRPAGRVAHDAGNRFEIEVRVTEGQSNPGERQEQQERKQDSCSHVSRAQRL